MSFTVKDWQNRPSTVTPINAAALEDLEQRLADYADTVAGSAAGPPLVSALPVSPADGEEVYFQNTAMAALGIAWHLRYRAAATTYKWEFVGGPALYLVDAAQAVQSTGGGAWAYIGSQQIVAPLAGDYELSMSSILGSGTSASTQKCSNGISVAGANPVAAAQVMRTTENALDAPVSIGGRVFTGLTSGSVIRPMHSYTGTNNVRTSDVQLLAKPVRVG